MARQIDRLTIRILHERQPDGSYTTVIQSVEGIVSDGAGANEYEKGPYNLNGKLDFDPAQTSGNLVRSAIDVIKAKSGMP